MERRAHEVREEKDRELARGDVVTAVAAHELGAARDDADRHLAGQWLGLFLAPAVFFAHLAAAPRGVVVGGHRRQAPQRGTRKHMKYSGTQIRTMKYQ